MTCSNATGDSVMGTGQATIFMPSARLVSSDFLRPGQRCGPLFTPHAIKSRPQLLPWADDWPALIQTGQASI